MSVECRPRNRLWRSGTQFARVYVSRRPFRYSTGGIWDTAVVRVCGTVRSMRDIPERSDERLWKKSANLRSDSIGGLTTLVDKVVRGRNS